MSETYKPSKHDRSVPHKNSMAERLADDPEMMAKVLERRRQADEDLASIERWARGGYSSGIPVDDPEALIPEEEQ